MLDSHPYLSAAQIEDRLKEEFADLPTVHSKTVYNFTESIRSHYGINKEPEKDPRQYEKLSETDYGMYAQVDFGQYHMLTPVSTRKKIYFFVMVLSRSRQKFVHLQSIPFTTETAIIAHQQAFKFFEGQPRKIIYDQDRLFIVDENLGDVTLTQNFKSYVEQAGFQTIFCRKSDPESKGKVENVVKYVEYNFLRGRIYTGDDHLNQSAISWLHRTANGKKHCGTQLIPNEQWVKEKAFLCSIKKSLAIEQQIPTKYKVRKDNTISYKSNFYTLPLGTYKNANTWVYLKEIGERIQILDLNNQLLTSHQICLSYGMTIRNFDHTRDKSQSLETLKVQVLQLFPDREKGLLVMELLKKERMRYTRDNLMFLKKYLPDFEEDIIVQTLDKCLDLDKLNARQLIEIASYYKLEKENRNKIKAIPITIELEKGRISYDTVPDCSQISLYETIL